VDGSGIKAICKVDNWLQRYSKMCLTQNSSDECYLPATTALCLQHLTIVPLTTYKRANQQHVEMCQNSKSGSPDLWVGVSHGVNMVPVPLNFCVRVSRSCCVTIGLQLYLTTSHRRPSSANQQRHHTIYHNACQVSLCE